MRFMAVAEAAVQYQIPVQVLRDLCERGVIEGAVRFGRVWTLPEDTSPHVLRAYSQQRRSVINEIQGF